MRNPLRRLGLRSYGSFRRAARRLVRRFFYSRRRTRRLAFAAVIVGLALLVGRLAIYAAESMGGWRGG